MVGFAKSLSVLHALVLNAAGELTDSGADKKMKRVGHLGTALLMVSCLGTLPEEALAQCPRTWSVAASSGPAARSYGKIAFDRDRGVGVLFGGYGPFNDTWEWDGTAWTNRNPAVAPKARSEHGLVYDEARGVVVLFGGYCNAQPNCDSFIINPSDTWTWDGSSWTQVGAPGPSARRAFGMAYDSVRQRVVLYGGATINFPTGADETWEWDGVAWTQRQVSGPPGLYYTHMCFDRARSKIVLYGGSRQYDGIHSPYNYDTWEFDGTSWTHVASNGPIETNGGYAIEFDEARGRAVLIGSKSTFAQTGSSPFQTFEWTGTSWQLVQLRGPHWPNDQWGGTGSLAYDPVRHELLTFAYQNNETWRFSTCYADFTCDGLVEDGDFVVFAAAYNLLLCEDPGMPLNCPADLNRDGLVDDADFVIFVAAYNELLC